MRADVIPCGTVSAYQRHRRRGEVTCKECRAANARAAGKWAGHGPRHRARGLLANFHSKVALPDENGCMLWLGGTNLNGYGSTTVDGKRVQAHRIMLWEAEGPPPDPERVCATHSCRQTLCVAPAHLRWATHAENMADKKRDGTENVGVRNAMAKLNSAKASAIRERYAAGGISYRELAEQYGVNSGTVGDLIRGKTWLNERAVS